MSYEAVLVGEYNNWTDDGCSLAPHCLSCPLPECRYLMPAKHAMAILHWLAIKPYVGGDMTQQQIADATGLSRRTVIRLSQQARAGAFTQ